MFASSFRLGALRRSFALYSANTKAAGGAALKPLERNIQFNEIIKPLWVIEPPNYLRQPLLKQFWEAQFANRSFFFFGNAWTSAAAFAAFLWWSRVFAFGVSPANYQERQRNPPPKERLDRYWLNSPKFRVLSAFHNPGKRPALKISLMTFEARYFYRGLDHPFSLSEIKDFLFKLRENYLINTYTGIQYPFVFRQFNRVSTPGTLEVHLSEPLPDDPHKKEEKH